MRNEHKTLMFKQVLFMDNWAYFLMNYFSNIETSKAPRYFDDVQQKKNFFIENNSIAAKSFFFKHFVSPFFYSKTKNLKTKQTFFYDYLKLTSLYDNEVVNDSKSVTI